MPGPLNDKRDLDLRDSGEWIKVMYRNGVTLMVVVENAGKLVACFQSLNLTDTLRIGKGCSCDMTQEKGANLLFVCLTSATLHSLFFSPDRGPAAVSHSTAKTRSVSSNGSSPSNEGTPKAEKGFA